MAGSASVSMTTHSTPARTERLAGDEGLMEGEQDDHYIYVTYPPELKRRLLERYARNQVTLVMLSPVYRRKVD